MPSAAQKQEYFERIVALTEEYNKILLVGADNVGSSHMQQIRKSLRGKGVLLMGKNTLMRKALRGNLAQKPEIAAILPYLKGNVGLLFTNGDLPALRETVLENRVPAAARAGAISPVDVVVPAGDTGMEPTQTAFLQALNIPSKINRGQVQIVSDVKLITKGDKVGSSEATLLSKLGIRPFSYGLSVDLVYDNGAVYGPDVLDLSPEDIQAAVKEAALNIAQISLATNIPSVPSVPHQIVNSFKNILSVALAGEYTFPQLEELKAAGAAAAAAGPAASEEKETAAAVEEEEESESSAGAGGLFGGDDDY